MTHIDVRLDQFRSYPNPMNSIVLIGDSLIERGQWDEMLPGFKSVNRGVSGATFGTYLASGILQSLDSSNEIIILLGINNFWKNESYENTKDQLVKFLDVVKKKDFKRVTIIKLLPTYYEQLDQKRNEIDKLNEDIEKLAKKYRVIDLSNALNDQSFFIDGVHLSGKGYKVVGDNILKYLKSL
ncbi:MAG: hypothetical protein GY909_01590 [Oligoflexia bacterium]|nr:hypothetical protein [Oligoflexia bacterium]